MPMPPVEMPEMDQLLRALSLIALLLYITPAVSRFRISARGAVKFRRAGILLLGVGVAITAVATLKWFMR